MGNCCLPEQQRKGGMKTKGRSALSPKKKGPVSFAGSEDDDEEEESPSKHATPQLKDNLMRQQKNRDPFQIYDVVEVLGVGSMGSVSRVKKKISSLGGSARFHNIKSRGLERLPIVGPLLKSVHHKSSQSLNLVASSSSIYSDSSQRSGGGGGSCSDGDAGNGVNGPSYEVYYALKSIHLSRVADESYVLELRNEIEVLKSLDHPHIVKPIETFEHRNQLFMVMELCSGGDLYTRDPYTEEEAARIVASLLGAVAYMHEHKVVHRDLKYENIMFADKTPQAEVKIIDFGLSKKYATENPVLKDGVGTIYTMAPQVLRGVYTEKADLWSVGVIAYMLLSSQMPFYGRKRRHVVDKIMKGEYDFKGRRWKMVSTQAKSFVKELLLMDPEERPSAEEAQRATWLNKRFAATVRHPDEEVMDNVQATIQTFAGYTKLKKLALLVVAHKSTSKEIGFLRKAFQKFDKRRNGEINKDEFKEALADYGYEEEELDEMFHGADIDGTGTIKYTEFLAATIEAHGAINEERIAEAFDRLDSDDSGYISVEDLQEVLGEDFPLSEIKSIILEADLKNNNRIDYEEFLALWDHDQEVKRTEALKSLAKRRLLRKSSTFTSTDTDTSMTEEELRAQELRAFDVIDTAKSADV